MWVQLTQRHRDIYNAPEIGGDDPGSDFDEHLALVGPDRLWVAEIDGDVVGLTGLIIIDEASQIEPIIVDGTCRGQGVGSALVGPMKQVAAESDLPELTVRSVGRNTRMLEFLSKQGFNAIGYVELISRENTGRTKWVDDAKVSGVRFLV